VANALVQRVKPLRNLSNRSVTVLAVSAGQEASRSLAAVVETFFELVEGALLLFRSG